MDKARPNYTDLRSQATDRDRESIDFSKKSNTHICHEMKRKEKKEKNV